MKTLKIIFGMFIFGCIISSCLKVPDYEIIGPFTDTNKPAKVETGSVIEILSTSARVQGNILDLGSGITEYGHCWCIQENPTPSEFRSALGPGREIGSYESVLGNLLPGTVYHVRAYAINGDKVAFGNDISFTTLKSE